MNFPGLILQGLIDIERNYLASFERSDISMYCQLSSPLVHYSFAYLWALHFELGLVGIGLAGVCSNLFLFLLQNYFVRNLAVAEEANKVKFADRRNFENFGTYLKLAIPSLFFITVEWSLYDIQILISGIISIQDQEGYVIFSNLVNVASTIGFGLQIAGCSLIGQQIGKGDLEMAKLINRKVNIMGFWCFLIEALLMYFCIQPLIHSITQSAPINMLCESTKVYFMVAMLLDFWQIVIGGAIRALGKQGVFALINFISYYMIALPLSFYLPFKVGSHQQMPDSNDNLLEVEGMGLKGLWLAMIIGLTNQVIL